MRIKALFGKKTTTSITLANLIGTLSYQGINFLLTPFLTRALGSADYGIVSIYTTWVNILVPILGLSTASVIPHIYLLIDEGDRNKYLSSTFGLAMVSFFSISLVLLMFLKQAATLLQMPAFVIVLLLLQCFGVICVNFAVAYFIQTKKPLMQFALTISVALVTFVLSILLVQSIPSQSEKYYGRIIGFAIPNAIAGIVMGLYIVRKGRRLFVFSVWKYALPICIPTIFHSISHIILGQSDRVMLQYMDSMDAVGFYSVFYTVSSLLSVLWSALNNAWAPFYMEQIKEGRQGEIKKSTWGYCFFYTCCFIAFVLVSPEIGLLAGGESFALGMDNIAILSMGFYFMFLYSFPVNYKTINKKTISIAVGTTASAFINIILNYFMIARWGIKGAALATMISYALLFVFHHITAFLMKADFAYPHRFWPFFLWALAASSGVGAFYAFYDIILVRWGIACVAVVVLFVRIIKKKAIY